MASFSSAFSAGRAVYSALYPVTCSRSCAFWSVLGSKETFDPMRFSVTLPGPFNSDALDCSEDPFVFTFPVFSIDAETEEDDDTSTLSD